MRRVILESPYKGDVDRNVAYARACLRDSLDHGEAPLASHLLYTQPCVLDDDLFCDRIKGMQAGWQWIDAADALVVYTDLGISNGMWTAIGAAKLRGVPVEFRSLQGES